MKKTFLKLLIREIKKNFVRFFSIIAIVALGVGFLIGLLSTTPDLKATIDKGLDQNNVADIQMKSTVGFDADTVASLSEVENISSWMPVYQQDQEIFVSNQKTVARVIKRDFSNEINRLTLVDGRFPIASNECVVHQNNDYFVNSKVNDLVTIDQVEYKIVGIVFDYWYFAKAEEPSLLSNFNLEAIVYLDDKLEDSIVTDIYLQITGAKELDCFGREYENKIEKVLDELNGFKEEQMPLIRQKLETNIYQEVYNGILQEVINRLVAEGLSLPQAQVMAKNQLEQAELKTLIEQTVETQMKELPIEWYFLTRNENASFYSFKINSKKVQDIAVIFPIFFFLVASLVALSTLTRMIEDDRTNIGTLRALGYRKQTIISKYLIYTVLACGIGSVLGIVLGIGLLPAVIYNVYCDMYFLPPLVITYQFLYINFSVLLMIFIILLVTLSLTIKTLKEKPTSLMQPKAPKAGKRILLEKIPFIWKRLKFKYKSTVRNLFRYKKNLLVMIIGVGGCCALLLTGFGIKDSFDTVGERQFREIIKYDLSIEGKDFSAGEYFTNYLEVKTTTGVVKNNKENLTVLLVASDSKLNEFIGFHSTKGKKYLFDENSVIITKQIADMLDVGVGDNIEFKNYNEVITTFKITNVCENYVDNYLYVGNKVLENKNLTINNSTWFAYYDKNTMTENQLSSILSVDSNVKSISFASGIQKRYDSIIGSLNYIILVLIVCSAGLAIIVIYNLTNINIMERTKEIATLKVLGYQKNEVAGYIFRETFIMTIFGVLAGLVMGVILHHFVIQRVASIGLTFGENIHWLSFIYAFVLSLGFSGIVDLFFIRKLRKIQMVESLKCMD